MNWSQVLELLITACAEQGEERRVLLVLPDAAYHVHEVVGGVPPAEGGLLAFVIYRDDPELSTRTDETSLLIVRPEQVLRLEVRGLDGVSEGGLGFGV